MSARIEVDEEIINIIKDLFAKGEPISFISKKIGYSEGVIKRIILENDFEKGFKEYNISYNELYNLYVIQKKNIAEVARALKVPNHRIQEKLKEYHISPRHVGYEPIGITKELLEDLYFNKKMKQKDIAKKLGCALSTVSNYFIKYKIKADSTRYKKPEKTYRVKITPEEEKELIKMCMEGKSKKEIAAHFGCSITTVGRKLRTAGLSLKRYTLGDLPYDFFYNMCIVENKGIKEIADMYHVSESTVKVQMYNVGFSLRKEQDKIRQEKTTKENLEYLYYEKGMLESEIADFLNIGRKYISKKFQEYEIYKESKYSHITKEVLEDLYVKQNIAPCYIGEKFNCPPSIIQAKIQKFKLRRYKTKEDIEAYRASAYEKSLNTRRSKGEKEIEKLFPTPYHNVHSIINLELDLWYPEKKVAIEYNGDYWHSIDFPRNSGLHLAKLAMCNNRGIQLINIFERDWHAAKSKKLLKVHLSRILTPEKFKLIIKEPLDCFIYETKQFENKYNLDGKGDGEKAIGIKDTANKFLSTISYKIENDKCVVSRYTTHENYIEDYTSLISFLKEKEQLPVVIKYDNRYYNKFPCSLEPIETQNIKPELFYVKSRKALRKEEASQEYLNHSKCRAVYDCGYTEITF
jgi:DNA-binding CsgD family transcriptional regulator/DNA-binding Lrp family transcriptional regulator